jgi:hypothetical protein
MWLFYFNLNLHRGSFKNRISTLRHRGTEKFFVDNPFFVLLCLRGEEKLMTFETTSKRG